MHDTGGHDAAPVFSAGVIDRAAEALTSLDSFNRAQVAFLMALAYESGREYGYDEHGEDFVAALRLAFGGQKARSVQHAVGSHIDWATRRQRRHDWDLDATAPTPQRPVRNRPGWPAVKQPGTATPDYLNDIRELAECPCERRTEQHWWLDEGYHRTPGPFPTAYHQRRDFRAAA